MLKILEELILIIRDRKKNPIDLSYTNKSKIGDINFWINSNVYNVVENVHQVWLLSIIDLVINKKLLNI